MDGWTILDAIKADIRRQKSANACLARWRPPTDKKRQLKLGLWMRKYRRQQGVRELASNRSTDLRYFLRRAQPIEPSHE